MIFSNGIGIVAQQIGMYCKNNLWDRSNEKAAALYVDVARRSYACSDVGDVAESVPLSVPWSVTVLMLMRCRRQASRINNRRPSGACCVCYTKADQSRSVPMASTRRSIISLVHKMLKQQQGAGRTRIGQSMASWAIHCNTRFITLSRFSSQNRHYLGSVWHQRSLRRIG